MESLQEAKFTASFHHRSAELDECLCGLSVVIINTSWKAVSNIVVDQTVLYLQMKSKQVKVQIKKLLFGGKQPEEKPRSRQRHVGMWMFKRQNENLNL